MKSNGNNRNSREKYVDISSVSKRKRIYKKRIKKIRIISLLVAFLFLISGSGLIYYYSVLDSLKFDDFSEQATSSSEDASVSDLSKGSSSLTDGSLLSDSKVLNIMIFGQDSATGGTEKYGRSDTMILLSIDNRNKKLKMTSFLRDTYVQIPGYDNAKLTEAYSYGGAKLSIKTIEANFGIKIDRYMIIDFKSFKSIIDVLGGIDIELTQDEIDYINFQSYINNQTTSQSEITNSPGVVHLNSRQALWYARDRGYEEDDHPEFVVSGDDHDRTSRQRNLINLLVNNFKSASLPQIIEIVGKIGPLVTTNFKKDEITKLVSNALTYLNYTKEELSVTPLEEIGTTWYYPEEHPAGSIIEIINWKTCRMNIAKFIYEDLITQSSV